MLYNKNAVVTGGSDGIGLAIARKLAENGANLILIARNNEKLKSAQEELLLFKTEVHILSVDLSDIRNLKAVAEKILQIFSRVDILINNAGVGRFVPFEKMNEKTLDLHLDLNVKSMYLLTQLLYNSLKEQKGNILNISSYFSHRMLPGRATTAYSMSKGAVDAFTKSLAFEVGKEGVRVNAIAPGSILTDQLTHNINQLSEEGKNKFNEMIKIIYPLEKIGTVDDIAEMALFLVSEKAQWITGSIMSVDGGLTTN